MNKWKMSGKEQAGITINVIAILLTGAVALALIFLNIIFSAQYQPFAPVLLPFQTSGFMVIDMFIAVGVLFLGYGLDKKIKITWWITACLYVVTIIASIPKTTWASSAVVTIFLAVVLLILLLTTYQSIKPFDIKQILDKA